MYLTEALAKYTLKLDYDSLDPEIIRQAKIFFADTMACMVAGAREKPVLLAAEYAKKYGGAATASIICSPVRTDPCSAALANGIAAHFHDFDDVSDSANSHTSVVVLPAVLALGEELGITGAQALAAYIAGIEVCALVGRGLGKENFRRGWHSTSTLGIFGAVAAAGKLIGLTQEQLTYALGMASSESSGIKANMGTMTKSFHAGSAAAKAIRITALAALGFDSNPGSMEIKCGFSDLTTSFADLSPIYEAIDGGISEFIDPGMVMKPYPCCKATHNGIDAVHALVVENDLHAEDIKHIDAWVQPYAMDGSRYPLAKTKLEGKFSLNYCAANIILNRELSLRDFEGVVVDDPAVIELMKKVTVSPSETLNDGELMMMRGDTVVRLCTNDGREFERRVNYAAGDPHNPLTEEQRLFKLRDCCGRNMDPHRIDGLLEIFNEIERLTDVSQLMEYVGE